MHNLCLARCHAYVINKAEHLFAAGKHELIDYLNGGSGCAVVVYLGIDEYRVCTVVMPDMNTEWLDAHLIGLDKTYWAINT